jgi:hypothetical protein
MKPGGLIAGGARLEITPRTPQFLAGYGARNHPSTGVHDPLFLRALYVRDAAGVEAAVVSADILWFGAWLPGRIRDLVGESLGIPRERLALFGVHTHSAPGVAKATHGDASASPGNRGEPDNYKEWLEGVAGKALAAITLAKDQAHPAIIKTARGTSMIGINRRERTKDGKIILGKNPKGPIDRELVAVGVDGTDGKPVARLANFACHGVVMGQESYKVSGDWCGNAARIIEKSQGEAPFLFLNGGCGNVNSRIGPQNSFAPVKLLAGEFGRDFKSAAGKFLPLHGVARIAGKERKVRLPGKDGKPREVVLKGLRIGPLTIVGFPGEMFSETVMAVKGAFPGRAVMVCSYSEDSLKGYLPVKEAYAEGGYEIGASPYSSGAEGKVRRELIRLVSSF